MSPFRQALIDLGLDPQREFDRLFHLGRPPRSPAYRRGVREGLVCFLRDGTAAKPVPYAPGTAESDAYFAGWDEARNEAGRLREQLVTTA